MILKEIILVVQLIYMLNFFFIRFWFEIQNCMIFFQTILYLILTICVKEVLSTFHLLVFIHA
jgi:hypothetical protein